VAGRPPELTGAWRVPTFAVNSRRDTLVPMGPTVQGIAALKRMGVNAEMIVLERPTHFQTSSHAEGLTQAVPWLKALWGR
jgi:pimeloyl-ACP methyl ester carboxylesterase